MKDWIEVGKMYVFMGSPHIPIERGTYCLVLKKHELYKFYQVLMEESIFWVRENELRLP